MFKLNELHSSHFNLIYIKLKSCITYEKKLKMS